MIFEEAVCRPCARNQIGRFIAHPWRTIFPSQPGGIGEGRRRVAAIRKPEARGYTFAGYFSRHPANEAIARADELDGLLVMRADELANCAEGRLFGGRRV